MPLSFNLRNPCFLTSSARSISVPFFVVLSLGIFSVGILTCGLLLRECVCVCVRVCSVCFCDGTILHPHPSLPPSPDGWRLDVFYAAIVWSGRCCLGHTNHFGAARVQSCLIHGLWCDPLPASRIKFFDREHHGWIDLACGSVGCLHPQDSVWCEGLCPNYSFVPRARCSSILDALMPYHCA